MRNTATISAHVEIGPAVLAGFAMPAIAASKEAAVRSQSMNNLKQLALAMHTYNAVQKRFPPAAIRDKDGKPLLSWRVAILPYLEGQQLYQEFHLDEPWDSEHNKALIAKMPPSFRDPHENQGSTNASYFMVTGKGTFGDDEKGRRMTEITDGTSNTIMLIEAHRDIPWTKPEDIEIDPDPAKPLPKFGGHMTSGWAAAFADGSVHFISDTADPMTLHAFFTIAGGEPADYAKLNPPENPNPQTPSPPKAPPPAAQGQGAAAGQPPQPPISLREAPLRAIGTLVDLALLPPVMKELGLEENSPTVAKLRALNERLAKEAQEASRKRRELGETASANLVDTVAVRKRPDADPELEKLLTAEQFTRLKGIHLQLLGNHTLAEPDVQAVLGFDEEQKSKVIAAIKEALDQQRALYARPGQLAEGMSIDEFEKKVSEQTAERDKKIDEILTAQQKAKLAQMKGKPFDMNAPAVSSKGAAAFPDRLIPNGSAKIEFGIVERQPGEGLQEVQLERSNGTQTRAYLRPAELTGEDVAKVAALRSTTGAGGSPEDYYSVEITFTGDGAKKMARLTEENLGKQLAILLDGKVLSAATIRSIISEKAQITANFTQEQAEQIAKSIRGE